MILSRPNIFVFLSFLCFAFTASLFYLRSDSNINEVQETLDISEAITKYIKTANDQFDNLESTNQDLFNENIEHEYPILKYDNGKLTQWTSSELIPDYRYVQGQYDIKFVVTVRNKFIALKRDIKNSEYYAIIPIYHDYKIENQYFRSGYNDEIFNSQSIIISQKPTEYQITYEGQHLFSISYLDDYHSITTVTQSLIVGLFYLGLIFLFIFIYYKCRLLTKKSFIKGFGFLLLGLFLVRYLLLELSLPGSLSSAEIFDSRVFASSVFNSSFGDLLVNLAILAVIANFIFYRFHKSRNYKSIYKLSEPWKFVIGVIGIGLFISLYHWLFLFFQTVYHNSQISYDINTSIILDSTRLVAICSYILFLYSIVLLSHGVLRTVRRVLPSNYKLIIATSLACALFALINTLIEQEYLPTLFTASLLFVFLAYSRLAKSVSTPGFSTFLYLFVLLIGSSILGSGAIYMFENEREVERKKKFANQFLIDNDHMAEYLLSVTNEKIKNDVFIQTRMASPFFSKDVIISKINQVYLSNYFDKYEVTTYLYDSKGESFEEGMNQQGRMMILDASEYQTGYDGIYFINLQEAGAAKRYLNYIEIKRRGIRVGYILMDLRLKRIVPENVYPEMLIDSRYILPYQNANYSYAVFDNDEITYSSGDFNYNNRFINDSNFQNLDEFSYGLFRHVAINDNAGHRIVISSTDHPITDIVSNFSFLFILKVFVVLLLTIIYSIFIWSKNAQPSYSTRIQLYLNAAFFLPLLAVSITTLSLINASFENEVIDEYYSKAENVGNNLSRILADFNKGISNDEELKQTITDVARYASSDLNVFNTSGKLLATNQPAIYENSILSGYLNPEAYRHIILQGEKAFNTQESVGELVYNSIYFGVKSFDTGELIGLVSIPFFDSENALQQSQIIVITNIINVFTVVFIIFLIISYFATNWLIFPLAFITQKLKRTSLTEFNEPLQWQADDEIGLMVGEYNKMLINLEDSKRALARSEKQSAWREIAQQVAHEIKNPLTPMKLTLQHLRRKLSDVQDPENKSKPIDSLLEQIETLDDIVSSFSSFAKMPIPESTKYELTEVIQRTVDLHKATKGLQISLQLPDEKVYTIGDEALMGRIISNLILNALQADDSSEMELEIGLNLEQQKIQMSFKDSGDGISEDIRQKIFIPNFTTKETGSGIGLAIAKHGIEHAGGKIWFETEAGKGTTFYIELSKSGE